MAKKTYYFIGINGIGMSGLAEMLVKLGHSVRGSDTCETIFHPYFESLGISVNKQQIAENIESSEWIIVLSSAIKPNNNELVQAQRLGCPIIKRGKLLADISAPFEHRISVVGTHGKTTTTSLILTIFLNSNKKPSYFVGGHINGQSHANIQSKKTLITELDESDGSFLDFSATNAVITNIEHDHVDFYESKNDVINAFSHFIKKTIENGGHCTINLDDPLSEKLYKKTGDPAPFITYAIENKQAKIRAENIEYNWNGSTFDLFVNQTLADTITLPLFGQHNIYNALAAIAIAISKDIPLRHILMALQSFSGIKRRLELKYQANGIFLFDDYAHHPTEIISTLEGVYKSHTQRRIITIFQPHRYSRLKNLFHAFSTSFSRSHHTFILPVYSAGEPSNPTFNSEALAKKMNENNPHSAQFCPTFESVVKELAQWLSTNDIVIIMGAGNITSISKDIIPIIKKCKANPTLVKVSH
jgi:UDP-N-acetylmuramate--alanine ligase